MVQAVQCVGYGSVSVVIKQGGVFALVISKSMSVVEPLQPDSD
jgi:hypothetical protein